jgi:hypothetical protein
VPILEHLYIDVEDFLKNIEKVRVLYDWYKTSCG